VSANTKRWVLLFVVLAAVTSPRAARGETPAPELSGHRRILDLEFHPLFSIPDAIGVCLEVFPMRSGLALEGCAALQVFESSALAVNASYRFALYSGPTLALSLGPAVGAHAIYDTPRGPLIDLTADAFATIEAVFWGERSGFQLQLGGGAMFFVWDQPSGITETIVPIVDLTVGIAFRTGGG
jgi:hypothetical protein